MAYSWLYVCMCEYCLSFSVDCDSERYRELIEAADTITEMKRSSDSVRSHACCLYFWIC